MRQSSALVSLDKRRVRRTHTFLGSSPGGKKPTCVNLVATVLVYGRETVSAAETMRYQETS